MKRRKISAIIGIAILGLCLSSKAMASEAEENKAVAAAKTWLALVDEGKYAKSWETSAIYFKDSTPKEKWGEMLTAVRKPLGKRVARELKSKTLTQSLPNLPDGKYVILQFVTSFENKTTGENKKTGIETITPMLDKAGKWRVSGYFIKLLGDDHGLTR